MIESTLMIVPAEAQGKALQRYGRRELQTLCM